MSTPVCRGTPMYISTYVGARSWPRGFPHAAARGAEKLAFCRHRTVRRCVCPLRAEVQGQHRQCDVGNQRAEVRDQQK